MLFIKPKTIFIIFLIAIIIPNEATTSKNYNTIKINIIFKIDIHFIF